MATRQTSSSNSFLGFLAQKLQRSEGTPLQDEVSPAAATDICQMAQTHRGVPALSGSSLETRAARKAGQIDIEPVFANVHSAATNAIRT